MGPHRSVLLAVDRVSSTLEGHVQQSSTSQGVRDGLHDQTLHNRLTC